MDRMQKELQETIERECERYARFLLGVYIKQGIAKKKEGMSNDRHSGNKTKP